MNKKYGRSGTHCSYCDKKIRKGERSKKIASMCRECVDKLYAQEEVERAND